MKKLTLKPLCGPKGRFVLFIFALALYLVTLPLSAQDLRTVVASAGADYEAATYISTAGDTLRYRYLAPPVVQEGRKYPLVLFLHGVGERGRDNELQLFHGSMQFSNPLNRDRFPAYVVFPQCPPDVFGAYAQRPESFDPSLMPVDADPTSFIVSVKELLDQLVAQQAVDQRRIYVMGVSMGGMATFDMAIRYPGFFAAAVPVCGAVNPDRLERTSTRWLIVHGEADSVVPVEGSRTAYRTLKAAGAQVEYLEIPGCDHNCWTPLFRRDDFLPWLFSVRSAPKRTRASRPAPGSPRSK